MNTNSNGYTIIYASILVIIVAFLLAAVSSSLKDQQEENVRLDTKKQILTSLGIDPSADPKGMYDNAVEGDYLLKDGELVPYDGEFCTNYSDTTNLHVFKCNVNGETKYVLPVRGAGLWGPIWGYVALNADKNTVYGTYFGHEGETPGLGAEIVKSAFTEQFKGKTLFDEAENSNTVLLGVEKNGKVSDARHQVDGISGGTITSKGVDAMLKQGLQRYASFLAKNDAPVAAVEPDSAMAAVCDSLAADSISKAATCEKSKAERTQCDGKGKAGYGDFSEVEKRIEAVDSIKKEIK